MFRCGAVCWRFNSTPLYVDSPSTVLNRAVTRNLFCRLQQLQKGFDKSREVSEQSLSLILNISLVPEPLDQNHIFGEIVSPSGYRK